MEDALAGALKVATEEGVAACVRNLARAVARDEIERLREELRETEEDRRDGAPHPADWAEYHAWAADQFADPKDPREETER